MVMTCVNFLLLEFEVLKLKCNKFIFDHEEVEPML